MDYDNIRVVDLKALAREHGLHCYSHLKKAALINFIRDSDRRPQPRQPTQPQPRQPTQPNQSIRFRPDRPRQFELMSRLEGISTQGRPAPRPTPQTRKVEFKPYELKSKREEEGKEFKDLQPSETNPIPNGKEMAKKLERMKKKLNELNRKIRHSKKKNDGLIHKRNALRKAIENVKSRTEPKRPVPKPKFIFKECEKAFGVAYRSYRVEGVPKMDPEMFFRRIREGLIEAIKRELGSRNSPGVQTTTWIRFMKDNERI